MIKGELRSPSEPSEFLSRAECIALFDKIVGMANGGGETRVTIGSTWSAWTHWVRSRVHVSAETRTATIVITRTVRGALGTTTTTRLDAEGLRHAVRDAEQSAMLRDEQYENFEEPVVEEPILHPTLWDDATYRFSADARTHLAQELLRGADDAGLLAFGGLTINASGLATLATNDPVRYYPTTEVVCSVTVRNPAGTASGWAGVNHYALNKIDPNAIAARALDKCQHLDKPSAIEPGRYTVILEPQAIADLFVPVLYWLSRESAERPEGPFGGREPGRSKIGERVLDPRLMLGADPMDPDGGFLPYELWTGVPYQSVNWVERGVLCALAYDKRYALRFLHLDKALPSARSFRLAPAPDVPTSTIEEMVARTQRGLLVTRLDGVRLIDMKSLLCTGYTRDGIWLIENGKVTRPIKNFRFSESPLLVLNRVEDVGVAQRVFAPGYAYVAPAVRVRDFNFTSLADGV